MEPRSGHRIAVKKNTEDKKVKNVKISPLKSHTFIHRNSKPN